MMGSKQRNFAPPINVSLEALVPHDHFYRHLERTLDFTFVREFVQQANAGSGRPSIDQVAFFKLQLVMFFEDIRFKAQCTTSTRGRSLCRSVDERYLDRVCAYHTTKAYKKALHKRRVWVESLFAEGKDWHRMQCFRLRLLWRVNREALMRAAGQNLK
jgi:hypothetical protein